MMISKKIKYTTQISVIPDKLNPIPFYSMGMLTMEPIHR